MIIGFLGKGGSGKSTLSARFSRFLLERGFTVLAVDADHNMDLSYNLGAPEASAYVGQGLPDLLRHVGVEGDYRRVFELAPRPEFRLSPPDAFTAAYAAEAGERLRVMTAGPHTERILNDQACSHSLVTPLKAYLPLLKLGPDEAAVVDEKAGVDGVGTGITTGFDAAVVAAEPTPHGIKAAAQIAEMLTFFGTPFLFALNKRRSEADEALFAERLGRAPDFVFPFDAGLALPSEAVPEAHAAEFARLVEEVRPLVGTRLERTLEKRRRADDYAQGR